MESDYLKCPWYGSLAKSFYILMCISKMHNFKKRINKGNVLKKKPDAGWYEILPENHEKNTINNVVYRIKLLFELMLSYVWNNVFGFPSS